MIRNNVCQAGSIFCLLVDAQFKCFESLQHNPGVERRRSRAQMAQPRIVDFLHPRRIAQDCPAHDAALAVHMLGGGIDDDIRAKLQRLLKDWRREDIIDHQNRASGLAEPGDRLDVDAVQQRVGRALDQDELAALGDLPLPGLKVSAIHENRLDAKFGHLIGDDPAAGSEQGRRGHDAISRFQRCQDRG